MEQKRLLKIKKKKGMSILFHNNRRFYIGYNERNEFECLKLYIFLYVLYVDKTVIPRLGHDVDIISSVQYDNGDETEPIVMEIAWKVVFVAVFLFAYNAMILSCLVLNCRYVSYHPLVITAGMKRVLRACTHCENDGHYFLDLHAVLEKIRPICLIDWGLYS
ncbi:hypothetical protein RFI_26865 [Reticulomyxa filosa]|uniref:Uncharacterized protein n=1 Tax=Reticulomyxa filosa TaxID=46433 RepID=X6MAL7_RETFI|nr:hypothetical protein RFI_26865 [Reticulomyxa filosa]|eukprot:ETO10512.1 hypothetical protein RFI_26865 [Reticulomyxa filosa]